MAITTAEVRVYSAEKCDELFARKGETGGSNPKILVLGKSDPVPDGTPAGTIILRKEA